LRGKYAELPDLPLWNQIAAAVARRKDVLKQKIHQWYSSYWSDRLLRDGDNCYEDQLEYLYRSITAHKDKAKVRIEEPYVEFYTEDEQTLLDIVSHMPKRDKRVIEIHWPGPGSRREALGRGEIFMPKITDYAYQVNFRTISLSTTKRTQIYEYLNSLGDLVKMTPGLTETLTKPKWAHSDTMWIYQSYFYTNDTSVCTFLNLIEPHLIHKILKIAQEPN
jgi:hypothetical protein